MYLRTTARRNKDGTLVRYLALAHNRRVTIQPVAGIQTLPLVSSVRTSNGRRPCLAAVAREERIAAKSWAPARVRMHPDTFCLIFTIRMSRSAGLLSNGTRRSEAKRR